MKHTGQFILCVSYLILGSAAVSSWQGDLRDATLKIVLAVFIGLMALDIKCRTK